MIWPARARLTIKLPDGKTVSGYYGGLDFWRRAQAASFAGYPWTCYVGRNHE